ncbi:hypothetical protein AD933_03900, partial [Acetobacter malorum]
LIQKSLFLWEDYPRKVATLPVLHERSIHLKHGKAAVFMRVAETKRINAASHNNGLLHTALQGCR